MLPLDRHGRQGGLTMTRRIPQRPGPMPAGINGRPRRRGWNHCPGKLINRGSRPRDRQHRSGPAGRSSRNLRRDVLSPYGSSRSAISGMRVSSPRRIRFSAACCTLSSTSSCLSGNSATAASASPSACAVPPRTLASANIRCQLAAPAFCAAASLSAGSAADAARRFSVSLSAIFSKATRSTSRDVDASATRSSPAGSLSFPVAARRSTSKLAFSARSASLPASVSVPSAPGLGGQFLMRRLYIWRGIGHFIPQPLERG